MEYRNRDREREKKVFNIEAWEPKTSVGKRVKAHEITTIEQIFHEGKGIEEAEIIEALLPNLKSDIIEIISVQRMTKNNRKQKYRATAIVGDGNGHVGVGVGKDVEVKAAIDSSIKDAKIKIIPIIMGCGSWQCACGTQHSLPLVAKGKCGSVEVILRPAPRGLGVVASEPVRKMLELGGVKDLWSFSRGRTRAKYNVLMATYKALLNVANMKNIAEVKSISSNKK
ncbi:MAG: 30S ribosomal protein S5 [Candidatus Marsarchaeota archaeon]|nr:30S ribosomal protein S5 [Candidatus Marsarchaeota archaeon]